MVLPMNRQLAARDWVAEAVRHLAGHGIDAVRVERLAAAMKVSKGSFYWHFKDLAALRAAMLAEWETHGTSVIIARVEAHDGDARARLRELARIVFAAEGSLERQIRAWAAHDAAAASVLDRVDTRRIAYVEALFVTAGFDTAIARTRSVFLYHALVGHFTLGRRARLAAAQLESIVTLLLSEDGSTPPASRRGKPSPRATPRGR